MDFSVIMGLVLSFLHGAKFDIIAVLVLVDVVIAVAAAIRNQEFDFTKLGDFLLRLVFPYVLVYLALYVAIKLVTDVESILGAGIDTAVFLIILASLVGAIMDNLKSLGLNIPNVRQVNAIKDQ